MRRSRPSAALVGMTVVCALTAACGSTVQVRGTATDGLGGTVVPPGGTAATAGGGPASAPVSQQQVSLGAAAGKGGSSSPIGSSAQVPTAAVPLPGTPGHPAAAGAPGVTDTTVKIGILTADKNQANAESAAYGVAGLAVGDLYAEQKAVTDYVNARGGIGGRRIVLVPYQVQLSDSQQQSAQAACQAWTEDDHVFAAINGGGQVSSDVATACLARHRTLFLTSPFIPGSQDFFDRYAPYYWTPNAFESVRMGRAYVEGLQAQGFFSGKHKLGLLYYDHPSLVDAYTKGVKPALSRLGVQLAPQDVYSITYPTDSSQNAATVSAIQNAELRMRAEGVDRIMFLDAGAGLAFFFATSAQSQGYHPLYGYMSGSNPSFLEQNLGASQLGGSIGVGWIPTADVTQSHLPPSPARALCQQIEHASHNDAASEDDLSFQLHTCAIVFFLRDVLAHAVSLSPQAFSSAAQALGSVPQISANSFGDVYSPGKAWGTGTYSFLRYQADCACFRYYGAKHSI